MLASLASTQREVFSARSGGGPLATNLSSQRNAARQNTATVSPATATLADQSSSSKVSLSEAGKSAAAGSAKRAAQTRLSPDEQKLVAQLKQRDRAVRAHEQAHMAAGGGLITGGATYAYQRGPDGVNYAVGGEVQIALRQGRTPEDTIANAQTVRAAALAPADPSSQDRAVAAAAGVMEAKARGELAEKPANPADPEADSATRQVAKLYANALSAAANPSLAPGETTAAQPDPASERTRHNLSDLYGLIAQTSTGFSASA